MKNSIQEPKTFPVMKTYRFVSDSGHGWLEVPIFELAYFRLLNKISSCSYISKVGTVWLEEDCDASIFLKAYSCLQATATNQPPEAPLV